MKNLFSVLLITTLAIASTLATPETPQDGVQAPIAVQAPITDEEGALWDKKKCKETGGPCNFACDRVAVEACVTNAGPGSFAACSSVFSCQLRCENKFGLQDPCGEVCASNDCVKTCNILRQSGSLISNDVDACNDVCNGCDKKCLDTFPPAIFTSSAKNCASGCKTRDTCRKDCAKTE